LLHVFVAPYASEQQHLDRTTTFYRLSAVLFSSTMRSKDPSKSILLNTPFDSPTGSTAMDDASLNYVSLMFEYVRPSREESTLADAFRVRSIPSQDDPAAGKRPASAVFVGRRGDLRFARGTHRTPCFDEKKCS
jgi:hypothetical protein